MEHLPEPSNQANGGPLAPRETRVAPGRYPEPTSGYPQESAGDDESRGGLLEYWLILRRYKGTLILIAFLGAVVGYLVTLPQTPIYQARTSIEIENLNENFLNIKSVNPTENGMNGSAIYDIQTQIRILQSASLIEGVVVKLKSAQLPKTADGRLSAWRKALNLPQPTVVDAYQQAILSAAGSLKVRTAGQTRIVELLVDSTDPATAALFANTLANEYIEKNLESRWKTTEKTTEWLSRQIDGMRIKLEQSEDRLQRYAREAGLIFTDEETNVSTAKLGQLQGALSTAQTDRIGKQSRYEMASKSPPEALPDVLSDLSLRDYQTKLTDLSRQIAELTSTYTAEYPKVKRAEAQYAIIEAAFNRERAAILKRIKNEYEEALRREQLLAIDYSTQAKLVGGEGERAIQYNILKREVDSNRQLYDTMLQQLKQATISSALRATNVHVVDPAKVPSYPYKPDARRSGLIGLMGGLFVGLAFVVMRDRADRSIKEPGLGIIPSATSAERKLLSPQGTKQRVELVSWQQRPSLIAEAFRSTLVSILFSGQNGSRPRVMVVTSAAPAEGKSTLVTNLSIAIAEVGQRVLLIDADLRRPRIHSIFGLESSPGLTELLKESDPAKLLDDLGMAIRQTDVENLYVLTSGKSTSAATSLLYGPKVQIILKELRAQFDTILIDTPPMLQIPDARVLARLADKVILVIRAGKTTRDGALAAHQKLREDGTGLLGTILNDWNPKHSTSGYYGYYKQYKDYGTNEDN
jgi:succinoglycan biosynthesis transport protein ExoP